METVAPVVEAKTPVAEVKAAVEERFEAPQELVPVPASVFDDDFFRAPTPRSGVVQEVGSRDSGVIEGNHYTSPVRVQQEDVRNVLADLPVVDSRVSAFGGTAVAVPVQAEPDELDIPAFLRRGN
jgi:cell division protein FtsZ